MRARAGVLAAILAGAAFTIAGAPARASEFAAAPAPGPRSGFEADAPAGLDPPPAAPLSAGLPAQDPIAFLFGGHKKKGSPGDSATAAAAAAADSAERAGLPALNAERAQVVLRSLTIPGWGQATLGHSTAAGVFALVEAGIWTSYIAFRVQEDLRTSSYVNTAQLFAGINLSSRDDEFRKIVGQYPSSDEYNRLVVARDAANIYLSDPNNLDYAGYHAYIAAHQLQGADTWRWAGPENMQRYTDQRKSAHRAAQRANTTLAAAIVNRLVSVLHVSRLR
ncbi:MAG TPA: hypothetical protein VI792_12360, partial [Candidatus Eisenbacteria bacterium]